MNNLCIIFYIPYIKLALIYNIGWFYRLNNYLVIYIYNLYIYIHLFLYALLPLLVSEPSSSPSFVGGCVNICVAFIILFLVISSLCFLDNLDIVYPLLLNYLSQIWVPSPKQWVLFQTVSPECRGMSGGRERTGYRKWENLAF